MAEPRQYLSEDLHGAVLDTGSGTGDMFLIQKSRRARSIAPVPWDRTRPYMIKRAEKRATETGILIDIRSDMAEALPYEDERFDIVIACSVLCTVSDVEQTLKAIHRVLKSDEELRFFNTCAQTGWEAAFGTLSHPSGSSSTLGVISIASPRRRSEKPLSK